MRLLSKFFLYLFSIIILFAIVGAAGGVYLLWHYGRELPDYKQLADYNPPTVTRVHAGDGQLIAEYAREKRVFVPISAIPRRVTNAFVAAEDQNFYRHHGVDPIALARAVATNIVYYVKGRRLIGASTITQQVAKNFLLTNEATLDRKIKEAILAFRIESALSKDRIMELYANEIYLGYGSFGVAAAALNYFGKSLDELTIAESAYLAALPKAPSNYHPIRRHDEAIARRNWVIDRMAEEGFITRAEAGEARMQPLKVVALNTSLTGSYSYFNDANYFVEEVRRELTDRYGPDGVTEGGLSVRTTISPKLQTMAIHALRQGLEQYDRRHGFRGPVTTIETDGNWIDALREVPMPKGVRGWSLAVVLKVHNAKAEIGLADESVGTIPFAEMRWARKPKKNQRVGSSLKHVSDALSVGDVVLVEPVKLGPPPKKGADPIEYPEGTYALRQVPEVNGAILAMDPHTGRVLAMVGGWSYERSQFNRATQAKRQPGSSFKPFVYLTALENGFTPATMILDAPFVMDQGPGLPKWKPANYSKKFYGPSPMRIGIEKSRNLMTVRLAKAVGIEKVAATARRFHLIENMPPQLSYSLGAGEVRLIDMVAAYGMIDNGGKELTATLVDQIQDRHGKTIFKHDERPCIGCQNVAYYGQDVPILPDVRKQIADSASTYQVITMMEGVVKRGTGRRLRSLGRPLAGKTGTTNDSRDAWFMGVTPDLVVGTYVGFDNPISLGRQPWGGQETGSSVAAPVIKAFFTEALKDQPSIPFRTPPGIQMVRIDAETGKLAGPGSNKVIVEAFKPGTEPKPNGSATIIDGSDVDLTGDGEEGRPLRGQTGSRRGLY